MSDKTFINGLNIKEKVINTKDGGTFTVLSVGIKKSAFLEQISSLPGEWVNIDIKKKRQPGENGTTHYAELNDWKPEQKQGNGAQWDTPQAAPEQTVTPEDVPF